MDAQAWPRVDWKAAWREPPPTPDFCLANFLAGSVGVVAAQAGIGKTALLLQIAVAVAAGVPVAGDLLPAPLVTGRAVFLASEDPPAILQRRAHFLLRSLEAQGLADGLAERLDRQLHFHSLRSRLPNLLAGSAIGESGLDRLTMLARDSRLLVLDPIRRFHRCNEQDYGQMSLLFDLLADIAGQTGCSILFAHHVPQPAQASDQDEPLGALGSSAFVDASRWVLNLTDMSPHEAAHLGIAPQERRNYVRASFTKSNYGPPLPARWLQRSPCHEGVFVTWEAQNACLSKGDLQ